MCLCVVDEGTGWLYSKHKKRALFRQKGREEKREEGKGGGYKNLS